MRCGVGLYRLVYQEEKAPSNLIEQMGRFRAFAAFDPVKPKFGDDQKIGLRIAPQPHRQGLIGLSALSSIPASPNGKSFRRGPKPTRSAGYLNMPVRAINAIGTRIQPASTWRCA
jgi:hypothetical protein